MKWKLFDSRELTEYANGFGAGFDFEKCEKGEYWIGNTYLNKLTANSNSGMQLGVKLKRENGQVAALSYKGKSYKRVFRELEFDKS